MQTLTSRLMRNMKWTILLPIFVFGAVSVSFGQVLSTKDGDWDDPTVWSTGQVPNSSFGTITVRHTVTVRASAFPDTSPLLLDQTTVGANGFSGDLIIEAGAGVTLVNGGGTDLTWTGAPTVGRVDVGGTLNIATSVTLAGNTTANFSFQSGSTYGHQAISATTVLPTATYDVASTILISAFTGGTATAAWNVPLGNVTYDCPGQGGGIVNFAGFLRQIRGSFQILNSGTGIIYLNRTGTSTVATTSDIQIGGDLTVSGISRLLLTASGVVEASVGGAFVFGPDASAGNSQSASTGTSTLNVTGTTSLNSGTWNFSSGTNGNGTFNLLGDFTTTGSVATETGGGTSQGNVNFIGTSAQQSFDPSGFAATTLNVNVNNALGVKMTSNLTLTGTLTLTQGSLLLPNVTLALNGPIALTSGSIANDASVLPAMPSLLIGGTGALPADLVITSGSSFNTFELNRSGATLTSSSNFSVLNLHLYAGTFNNTGTVTMQNAGLVDRRATSAAATGNLNAALSAAGSFDVQYTNNVALTTGPELPSNATFLRNLTKLGTNTLTLNSGITVNGNLTVSAGTLSDGGVSKNIDLIGDYASGGTASTLSATTFTFATAGPTSTFSGAIAPTFASLTFNHNTSVTASFRVNGNLGVGASTVVTATAGTASFGGTTAVTNSGTLNLNAVTVLANSSLTAPASTMGIAGNFTLTNGTSTFTNNGGTILFNGTSTLLGTGPTFNNVTVTGTLAGGISLTIAGNLVNNGTLNFTAGTTTFSGATTTFTGTPTTTSFSTTTVSAGASVTSSIPFTSKANFTINGTVVANSGFTANGGVTVTATGTLTINNAPFSVAGALQVTTPGTVTANASANATLSSNITASGAINLQAQTTFPSTTAMSGAGAKTLNNVVITGSLTPNSAYTVTGNISLSGTGTLAAGSSTTTFGGTTVLTNSGSGAVSFNNITVSGTRTFSTSTNISILGATVTFTGDFTSTALTTFNRAGTITMSGAGGSTFNDITITSGTTLTPNKAYTVTGNVSSTGTLGAGNNTATFDGNTTLSITPPGTISFNNFVLNPSRTLTSDVGTITVNGNFTDNGTFNSNSGTVAFAGNTVSRVVNGSSVTPFFNISVANGTQATDVSIETDKDLFGVLTMAANARMDPDGSANTAVFTLRSTADSPASDASIDVLPSPALAPAQINGSITVQRYMSAEGRIYRYISTPVQGATVASWQDNFPITGTFADPSNPGFICGRTVKPNSPSLYTYSEATNAYVAYPTSGLASANPLAVGTGYAAFIRACSSPTIIDTRGTLVNGVNMGTINLPVTFTGAAAQHYNLVGNPYPSAIDWDNFNARTNVSGTIAIRDNASGIFHYWTNTTLGANGTGDIPNGVIAQGQAFWASTTAIGPTLQVTEAAKVASPASSGNTFFREITPDPDLLQIEVFSSAQNQGDKTYILQVPQALAGLDSVDGPKLDNYLDDPFVQLMDLYTSMGVNGTALAVNALPKVDCSTSIILGLKDTKPGAYSYSFHKSGSIRNLIVRLYDKFTGQTTDMADGVAYSFAISTDASSKAADRFSISFSEQPVNLDLPVQSVSKVCSTDKFANVIVSSSETGISYGVQVNGVTSTLVVQGSGSEISFPIPTSLLTTGSNHIEIVAKGLCNPANLHQAVDIQKDVISLASATADPHCKEGSVTLHASGTPAQGSYSWYDGADTTVAIASQSGDKFVTPVLSKSKTYYVSAVNSNGCEGPKVAVLAEIVLYDDAAIQVTGTPPTVQFLSNASAGNQWYLNGIAISGATSPTYSTSVEGSYTVQVTNGSCVSESPSYENRTSVVAGLGDEDTFAGISFTPNPVVGILKVRLVAVQQPKVVINTAKGQPVGEIRMVESGDKWVGQYDFTSMSAGVYIVEVTDGVKKSGYRVVKD